MTERGLVEALHGLVDDVPVPSPPTGLWRRGRRRRLIRTAAALTAAGVVAMAIAVPITRGRPVPTPQPGTPPSAIPSAIRTPLPWQRTVQESPPGPAALIVTGEGAFRGSDVMGGYEGRTVVVGRTGRYRLIDGANEGEAGADILLSPDGRFVAVLGPVEDADQLDFGTTALVDLTTGRIRPLDGRPIAWAPDGRSLVVQLKSGGPARLVDVASGRVGPSLDTPGMADGDRVAFSADQRAVAVQNGSRLYVLDGRTGAQRAVFNTGTSRLAGPGAWTADGRLAVWELVSGCQPDCDFPSPGNGEFRLAFLDATSGTDAGGAEFDRLHSQTPELLGWHPNGEPVVGAYRMAPVPQPTPAPTGADRWGLRVIALRPGGGQTELVRVPQDVHHVELARDLLTAGRFGGAPPSGGARFRDWVGGLTWQLIVIMLGIAAAIVVWRWRRARR